MRQESRLPIEHTQNNQEIQILKDVVNRSSDYHLPRLTSVEVATGGVIHDVFRLVADTGERFYLKIRGNRFSSLPQFTCNPHDIIYEYKATVLLHDIAPENTPYPLFFDAERHFMILTDALPNGQTLESLLCTREIRPTILNTIGTTLGFIHEGLKGVREPIRGESENLFLSTKLQQKFGRSNHPILNRLIEELSIQSAHQLIIGDLLPKNIGVNNDGLLITFFDLEDVHLGTIDFELGYLIGHLILHSHNSTEAIDYISSLLKGYQKDDDQSVNRLKIVALGSVIHRLNSIAPYSLKFLAQEKASIQKRAEEMLNEISYTQISWSDLIQRIKT